MCSLTHIRCENQSQTMSCIQLLHKKKKPKNKTQKLKNKNQKGKVGTRGKDGNMALMTGHYITALSK